MTTWDSTAVKSVQFIPGLDKVALGLEDQVILYAPQDPQTIERLPLPASDIPWMNPGLLFSPDGSLVARLRGECPSDSQRCHIEVGSRSGEPTLLGLETDVFSAIAISPDDRYLFLGNSNGLTVYSLSNGKQVTILPESVYFDHLAISPDGSLAGGFVGTGDYVNIYRLPSGDLAYRLQPPAYAGAFYPNNAVFSPDGKTLAVGANGLIGIWQAEDGTELRFWQPHNVEIGDMGFSPDGKLLVSGDSDGNLVISDVAQGKAVNNFKAHRGLIWRAFFAAQGRLLCTFGQDGLLRVWGIPPI